MCIAHTRWRSDVSDIDESARSVVWRCLVDATVAVYFAAMSPNDRHAAKGSCWETLRQLLPQDQHKLLHSCSSTQQDHIIE